MLAYDPATKVFYISSVYQRKILSLDQKGEVRDFATESDGLWSVMGTLLIIGALFCSIRCRRALNALSSLRLEKSSSFAAGTTKPMFAILPSPSSASSTRPFNA